MELQKRKYHHIVEMACSMLIDAHMLETFWHGIVVTAVYVINGLPTAALHDLCPFSKLFSKPPNHSFLCVFGSQYFPNLTPYTKHNLQPRSVRYVFINL